MTFTLQHFTSRLIHIPFYSDIIVSASPQPLSPSLSLSLFLSLSLYFSLSCRSPTLVQQSMRKCQQKERRTTMTPSHGAVVLVYVAFYIQGEIWLKSWRLRHESHVLNCDTVSFQNIPVVSEWHQDEWKERLISNKLELTYYGWMCLPPTPPLMLRQRSEPAPAPCPWVGVSCVWKLWK